MKVAPPQMGNLCLPLRTLFRELNVDMVEPPPNSRRTLSLGVQHSPEGLCLPFKLTLGNFIEALELGADTLIQAGGRGLCRLGYYAQIQERILREMGFEFQMVTTEVSQNKFVGLMRLFKRLSNDAPWPRIISAFRFALAKLYVVDDIERQVHKTRAIELEKGTAQHIYREAIAAIDKADSYAEMKRAKHDFLNRLLAVPSRPNADPITVGLIGEFYVVLEPFSNMDVEVELGKLGAEVKRNVFISDWTKFSLFLNPFGVDEKKKIHEAAMPYLSRDVGGDGWESVGEKAYHAKHFDGLVHLAPFTCMPEIIAQNIMPSVKEDIPVLTITCDEQMGKAGMMTRLEAFVDLLARRRRTRYNTHNNN